MRRSLRLGHLTGQRGQHCGLATSAASLAGVSVGFLLRSPSFDLLLPNQPVLSTAHRYTAEDRARLFLKWSRLAFAISCALLLLPMHVVVVSAQALGILVFEEE
jgi:hypothetical protein